MTALGPVFTTQLFLPLHRRLMEVLGALSPEDWQRPTACGSWTVQDIAAHMLDTQIRILSSGRDGAPLPPPPAPIEGYADLVAFLDALNAQWVQVARRFSPRLLMDLLALVGPQLAEHYAVQDPEGEAQFPVAWAGEEASRAWFDIGRNYTEYWLHQQQIRDAVGASGLLDRAWLHPVLSLFIRSLPRAYMPVQAHDGCAIGVTITGPAGGDWCLIRTGDRWRLEAGSRPPFATRIELSDDTAWRLFSKGLRPDEARSRVVFQGDPVLGEPFLHALAIMG